MNYPFPSGIARQAAKILSKAYGKYAGSQTSDLCASFSIEVRNTVEDSFGAYLHYPDPGKMEKKWLILLPRQEISTVRRDFLIFHEMAHMFLWNTQALGTEQYWEMESWCDNFAIAMLFAGVGYSVTSEGDIEFFVRSSRAGTSYEANRRAGEMLARICNEASGSVESGLLEPILELSGDLLAVSKEAEGGSDESEQL